MLLSAGFDIHLRYKGYSALMHAVEEAHYVMVQILIRADADANDRYTNGMTVLMLAAEEGNTRIALA